MHNQKQHGFTLVELMTTVAILAIVATIAIPAYNGYITTSHKTECHNEVAAIRLAEEEHFLDNNFYFKGNNVGELEANSSNTYKASSAAKSGKTECDYSVSVTATTYDIKATGNANNHLASIATVVELSGP